MYVLKQYSASDSQLKSHLDSQPNSLEIDQPSSLEPIWCQWVHRGGNKEPIVPSYSEERHLPFDGATWDPDKGFTAGWQTIPSNEDARRSCYV